MSEEIRDICMAKNSNNGETIRQELITCRHSKNGVMRHSVKGFFKSDQMLATTVQRVKL